MDLLNISIDDNEEDTSFDEIESQDENTDESCSEQNQEETEEVKNKPIDDTGTKKMNGSRVKRLIKNPNVSIVGNNTLSLQFTDWERPQVPLDRMFFSSSASQSQPEPFQFYIIDSMSSITRVKHPGLQLSPIVQDLPLHNVIRLIGVTTIPKERLSFVENVHGEQVEQDFEFDIEDNNDISHHETEFTASVCCNVHGFEPYLYALPIALDFNVEEVIWLSPPYFMDFERKLNQEIKTAVLENSAYVDFHEFVTENPCVSKIIPLEGLGQDDGIYQFFESKLGTGSKSKSMILKIYCTLPRFVWVANNILDSLVHCDSWKFQCFESTINNNIRFLTDTNIYSCSWYELKTGKYFLRNSVECPQKESHCQIELDILYKDIVKLPENHPRYDLKPSLRVLSFDIEVMVPSNDLSAPADGRRQVLQIGSVLGNYYSGADPKSSIIGKTAFVLGTCDAMDDTKVIQFYIGENPGLTDERYLEDAESCLLEAWRNFVIQMDPDIITGYNIKKFDLPYIIDRSHIIQSGSTHTLQYLGRISKLKSQIRLIQNPNKKLYPHDEKNINIQGRLVVDLFPLLYRHDRRGGFGYLKLANVAKRFLNKEEEKLDVKYTEIEELQHGNSRSRSRMARYCVQDALIPYLLLFEPVPCRGSESVTFIDLYCKKSRTGGTLLRYLFNKSMTYNEYFKQVRLQKNPGQVTYVMDTPSPKKKVRIRTTDNNQPSPQASKTGAKRNLFSTDSAYDASLPDDDN